MLVSCDHDFVQLLFASGDTRPSVILVREAGIVAIADQYAHKKLGFINPALYRLEQEHAPGLVDVTKGSNTVSFTQGGKTITIKGYRARPGYDLVTGAGTIDAARFVPELARTG